MNLRRLNQVFFDLSVRWKSPNDQICFELHISALRCFDFYLYYYLLFVKFLNDVFICRLSWKKKICGSCQCISSQGTLTFFSMILIFFHYNLFTVFCQFPTVQLLFHLHCFYMLGFLNVVNKVCVESFGSAITHTLFSKEASKNSLKSKHLC